MTTGENPCSYFYLMKSSDVFSKIPGFYTFDDHRDRDS